MEALIIKKGNPKLSNIKYEYGHNMLTMFGKYKKKKNKKSSLIIAKRMAENAWICRTFGQFLHTLCPEKVKKTLISMRGMKGIIAVPCRSSLTELVLKKDY